MTCKIIEPLSDIRNKMFQTKSARFNAHSRLRHIQGCSNYSLMFMSSYLIGLSAGKPFAVPILKDVSDFWSLFFSVILLGVSAIEAGSDRRDRAESLHENALKINFLHNKALLLDQDDSQAIKAIAVEYKEVLSECEFNHDLIDDCRVRWGNSWLPNSDRFFSFVQWFFLCIFSSSTMYLALIVIPPVLYIYSLLKAVL